MSTNSLTLSKRRLTTQSMVYISMLSAIAIVLMYFDFPLPIFPSFLKIDLSDIPAIVGTFTFGPLAGLLIEGLKVIIYALVKGTSSAGVGEVANFIVGAAYILPLGLILRYMKNKKKIMYGLAAGFISMIIIAAVGNYFFFIPAFAKVFGAPISSFVDASHAVIPWVTDLKTMILFAIVPFNIIKAAFMTAGGYYLYHFLKPILKRMNV